MRTQTPAVLALAISLMGGIPAESLLAKLLRIAGLTAAPSQMRGPDDEQPEPGDVWVADLSDGTTSALTKDGGYRSPIYGPDRRLYALRAGTIVRLRADGSIEASVRAPGVVKLVGFDTQNGDEAIVLLAGAGGKSPIASLSVARGNLSPLPFDPASAEEQRMLAQMRGQERVYGDTVVYTKLEHKQGLVRQIEWSDVYIRRGRNEPSNVSRCDGTDCIEPALSSDARRVVFIKSGS